MYFHRLKEKNHLLFLLITLAILPIALIAVKLKQRLIPRAATEQATVTIEPVNVRKVVQEPFLIKLNLSTSAPVSATTLTFTYDSDIITVEEIRFDNQFFSDNLSPDIDNNQTGKLIISAVSKTRDSSLPIGTVNLGEIVLRGKKVGTSSFNLEEAQIVGPSQNAQFSLFEVDQPQPPEIIIQEESPPMISFRLRAFGITSQSPPLPVKLKVIRSGTDESWDFTATLTYDDQGSYTTGGWLILSGVIPKQSYHIIVKGPKHLARRLETEKELLSGQNDQNIFDWRDKPLQPGDLPNPAENNQQDGKIDAKDISLILERFGKSDAQSTTVADLNYDGVVNLNDFALLLGTLKTKDKDDQ